MKRSIDFSRKGLECVLTLALVLMMGAASAAPSRLVQISVDRADGIYETGTPATFTITTTGTLPAGGIDVQYVFIRDGLTTASSGTIHLDGQPVELKQIRDQAGQMACRVTWSKPVRGMCQTGAIWDPFKLQPGMGCPADFDEFWAKQKAAVAGDYKAEVVQIPSSDPKTDLFHVKIPMPDGRPVQGYMAKPHGAKKHSLPAVAYTHGAGVRSSQKPGAFIAGGMGVIAFNFNAHGIDDGQPDDYYTKLANGDLRTYRTAGWDNPDTVYFRGMYQRVLRAVDFLAKQPEWDGQTLAFFGGSQGGAQAIVAGALDPRVTVVVAGIPALCDLNAWKNNRVDGWPHIVRVGKDGQPIDPKISETAGYYDSVNFARRIKCDAFFMTGLVDTTCPPCTVLPAYNVVQSARKKMVTVPYKEHEFSSDRKTAEFFIKEYSEAQKAKLAAK